MTATRLTQIDVALQGTKYKLNSFVLNPSDANGDVLFARVQYNPFYNEALHDGEWFKVLDHDGLSFDIKNTENN